MGNMHILFILFFILTFKDTWAENNFAEEVVCSDQVEFFGSGEGRDELSLPCLSFYKNNSIKETQVQSAKLNVNFYGYKNAIVAERTITKKNGDKEIVQKITDVIAGSSTELKNIKSLLIDEKNEELIVLEKSGDIYFYTTKFSGNIAPLRIIRSKEIQDVDTIALDLEKDQIILTSKKMKKKFYLSRLGNIFAPKEKQKLEILKLENL